MLEVFEEVRYWLMLLPRGVFHSDLGALGGTATSELTMFWSHSSFSILGLRGARRSKEGSDRDRHGSVHA